MLDRALFGLPDPQSTLLGGQNRRQWLTTVAASTAAWSLALSRPAWAQSPKQSPPAKPLADPRDFMLNITEGVVHPGKDRCVICRTAGGDEVVARLWAEVGPSSVVMLPNGRLNALSSDETKPTTKPFIPATVQQVAAELAAKQFAGFKVRTSRRYVYLYNTSELFSGGARNILEPMYSGVYLYAKGQKIEAHPPETPLVVIMFRTEQEFQEYQRMPTGVVAYYSPVTNYVVMYEQSKLSEMAPEIALRQAISTIAHEGAHQILHNIGVQQRMSHWPTWICEGLAEYFAPTTTTSQLTWKGAGQLNELRLMELDRYMRKRPPDAHGDLVEETIDAAQLTSTGYATSWAITHYLIQKQASKFFVFLQELSRIGPFEGGARADKHGHIPEYRAMFVRHFGNDMQALEDQIVLHLQKLLAKQ